MRGSILGLKQAGFEVIGAVDIDGLTVETYKVNHKEVEVWEEDKERLSVQKVKRKLCLKKGSLLCWLGVHLTKDSRLSGRSTGTGS